MSWVKIDDRYAHHPKILAAGPLAMALDIAGMCYAAAHETDGRIPTAALALLTPFLTPPKQRAAAAKLVEVGRWETIPGGWQIHDFLAYNPSAAERHERLDFNARRQALFRDKDLREAVRKRDQNHCRYCNREVRWKDRRGDLGGTYDHIDPRGPNSTENLVVACRSCNSSKGNRTPAEAGMVLLPIYRGPTPEARSEPDYKQGSRPHPRPAEGGDGDPPKPPHPQPSGPAPPSSATPGGDADAAGQTHPPPTLTSTNGSTGDPPSEAGTDPQTGLPPEVIAAFDAALGPNWRRSFPSKTDQNPDEFEAKRKQELARLEALIASETNVDEVAP